MKNMDIIKEDSLSGSMDKEGDDLHQAMCCLVKSDEIRADKELMVKLEPYMAEHAEKVKKSASLKDLWAKGKADVAAKEKADDAKKAENKKLGEPEKEDSEEESKESEARTKISPKIASKA